MDINTLPSELLTQMREAAEAALSSARDPETMKKACARMDRMREEIKRKHGVLDLGVPAIRELRDE